MDADSEADLIRQAQAVLEANNQGNYTVPSRKLYPYQWLWDSCFVAIGLRHLDIDRSKTEILSLLRGQWHNGMIPHIILAKVEPKHRHHDMWRSWLNKYSPDNEATSGITQPPMLAEAIVKIGERLKKPERLSWYKQTFPSLLRHHEWLYNERDPHKEGLVLQIHPWETGLDNTPPWMSEMHEHSMPLWISAIEKTHLGWLLNLFRRDTKFVLAEDRLNIIEALVLYSTLRRLRRKSYDIDKILSHSLFAIEDLTFNCILIRANHHLKSIAQDLDIQLSAELRTQMKKTEEALEQLWDPYSGQYYSRNFVTHKLLKEPSIATLMPLYAGCLNKERADQLVRLIENQHVFGSHYPLPTVPINSSWFKPHGYWQGPTWVNTNWLVIDGLERMGYNDHAAALKESTIEMVSLGGFYEYFSPQDGTPAGTDNFSWTAALAIDLIKRS